MLSKVAKMIEFNQYQEFDKIPSIIYVDLGSLIKRIDECKKDSEKSSTTKVGEHIPCYYSISTIWMFSSKENKPDEYRREDCMKKFCKSLRKHRIKIIKFKKKKIMPLTKER